MDRIYTGSDFDLGKKSLLTWALYPPDKLPIFIDTGKIFGHLMVHQVGETDLVEITDFKINVEKFNKSQIKKLVKEKNIYKSRSELMEQENAKLKDNLNYAHDPLQTIFQSNTVFL